MNGDVHFHRATYLCTVQVCVYVLGSGGGVGQGDRGG